MFFYISFLENKIYFMSIILKLLIPILFISCGNHKQDGAYYKSKESSKKNVVIDSVQSLLKPSFSSV